MLNTLLRFICLSLPICAGIELKILSKEEKQRRSTKANSPWQVKEPQRRVRGEQVPECTRNHSHSTHNGEQEASEFATTSERRAQKASKFQRALVFTRPQLAMANQRRTTRNGEWIYSRGELGRLKLLRGDMSQTHWWRNLHSPWRMMLLAGRVDADQKSLYKPTWSIHLKILVSHILNFCNSLEREIWLVLHRVRVIEGWFFIFCWEITSCNESFSFNSFLQSFHDNE